MYAESKVTSSRVHVIHTDSSTIVLPDMAEFTCCTHALIVESKRLASCGTVAMASMSGKIVFLTLALYRMSRYFPHTFNVSLQRVRYSLLIIIHSWVHTSGDVTRVRVLDVLVCKQEKVAENLQHM